MDKIRRYPRRICRHGLFLNEFTGNYPFTNTNTDSTDATDVCVYLSVLIGSVNACAESDTVHILSARSEVSKFRRG